MAGNKKSKKALNNKKYEVASEIGVNLNQGYSGDLPDAYASMGPAMVGNTNDAQQKKNNIMK